MKNKLIELEIVGYVIFNSILILFGLHWVKTKEYFQLFLICILFGVVAREINTLLNKIIKSTERK